MPIARTRTVIVIGVTGQLVEVEADISAGLPGMAIVGLADTAVGEARDRARAAVSNSAEEWPNRRITVGLSPASLHKHGSSLDLAIAITVLAAAGKVPIESIGNLVIVGELGLDGRVRAIRGTLPAALAARSIGASLVVPLLNVREAELVPDLQVYAVADLRSLLALLRDPEHWTATEPTPESADHAGDMVHLPDLADVRGQPSARLGLELAAAGGHHVAMVGPPGIGKTLLAERLPGILPKLDDEAALEVTSIHSIAGRLSDCGDLIRHAPFVAPHHTASVAALIGGGSKVPKLGLISLAHHGVLFLDEAPEFDQSVLDSLRQPMESGSVVLSRAGFSALLPARFQLTLAANPCPCGGVDECSCTSLQRRRYLARLSGPLLDRIDIRLHLAKPTLAELVFGDGGSESSATVAERVLVARERALARLRGTPWRVNAAIPGAQLRRRWPLAHEAMKPIEDAFRSGRGTARGLDRVVRLAWTVADLVGHPAPTLSDVGTALLQRDADGRWAA